MASKKKRCSHPSRKRVKLIGGDEWCLCGAVREQVMVTVPLTGRECWTGRYTPWRYPEGSK